MPEGWYIVFEEMFLYVIGEGPYCWDEDINPVLLYPPYTFFLPADEIYYLSIGFSTPILLLSPNEFLWIVPYGLT